jgi:hypothetical protein
MKNLNEYQLEIKNDEDLARWKSTWSPGEPIPEEVIIYMNDMVIPRLNREAEETLNRLENLYENKRTV